MAGSAEFEKKQPIPVDERVLTEIDHVSRNRLPDGSYAPEMLDDLLVNLTTAIQEAAMPFAVSTTEHTYMLNPETGKRVPMWLGRTAVEAAMSGYEFHRHESARKRVDVEVDEAATDLQPGMAKVFISPRMSPTDADHAVAKQEHLADSDSVRVSWPIVGEDGQIETRILQSLLVKDVPLEAWAAMLEDPANIFGKSVVVDNPESALSVMSVHRELEIPLEKLSNGPVSMVEAVLPYVDDRQTARKISEQIKRYHGDQTEMQRRAENIAERWLAFEIALSESLDNGFASYDIRRFIITLQAEWGDEDLQIIKNHELEDTEYRMSRELAVVLEKAKRNLLWAPAAVISNNPEVLKQLDHATAEKIRTNELSIQMAWAQGQNIASLESKSNRLVANQNIKVGGGCPGEIETNFKNNKEGGENDNKNLWEQDGDDKNTWKWKRGQCRVQSCSTRPGQTEIGPCDVCRKCQAKFDKGGDPTKESVLNQQPTSSPRRTLFATAVKELVNV